MLEPDMLRRKGRVLAALGRDDAAATQLRAALDLAQSLGMRFLVLRISEELALLLHRHAQSADASRIFEQACCDWPEGPSAPVVVSARQTLSAAGIATRVG
jgi:hypothetical protein